MEELVIKKYQSDDGQIWDTKEDCLKMNEKLNWQKNIPKEVEEIRECLIKLFAIPDKEEWFVINKMNTIGNDLEFEILFTHSCSNKDYTKAIGELLIELSKLPHSCISFSKYTDSYCTLQIHKYRYKDDLKWLQKRLVA